MRFKLISIILKMHDVLFSGCLSRNFPDRRPTLTRSRSFHHERVASAHIRLAVRYILLIDFPNRPSASQLSNSPRAIFPECLQRPCAIRSPLPTHVLVLGSTVGDPCQAVNRAGGNPPAGRRRIRGSEQSPSNLTSVSVTEPRGRGPRWARSGHLGSATCKVDEMVANVMVDGPLVGVCSVGEKQA